MPKGKYFLKRQDCLLAVIDAQEKLMPAVWENERVTDNLVRLVKFAGIIGVPVVLTEQEKLGPTLPVIKQGLTQVKPIRKISFDCFGCQDFLSVLEAYGRSTLLLTGVEAHICVMQTALSALENYRVHVVSDATSSRSKHNWEASIERSRDSGVTITTTEMLIYELLGQAGTDEFRATLPLIK